MRTLKQANIDTTVSEMANMSDAGTTRVAALALAIAREERAARAERLTMPDTTETTEAV